MDGEHHGAMIGNCRFRLLLSFLTLLWLAWPGCAWEGHHLLIFRSEGRHFEDVVKGMTYELHGDFELENVIVDKRTTVRDIGRAVDRVQPKIVVLMDNSAISLFKQYQKAAKSSVPSISLLGVRIDKMIEGLDNAAGISYEIPIVTSVVNLRAFLRTPVKRVGIIYREFLEDYIELNREYCQREGIVLVGRKIPKTERSTKNGVRRYLDDLLTREKVDALWVPNDNALLLHNDLMRSVWIPRLEKSRVPVIVNVDALVLPDLDFGTFAVIPDHVSLGSQAAELVLEAMKNGWKVRKRGVEVPLSVYQIVNYRQAKRHFSISEEALRTIDTVVK